MAKAMVQDTVNEFQAHVNDKHRMPSPRWKLVKRRNNLSVFKNSKQQADGTPLRMIGSTNGSLDDIMYGIVGSTTESMRSKVSLSDLDAVDGAVVVPIQLPSTANPFRFVGIKWLVRSPQSRVRMLSRPRDYVYLESTGILEQDTMNDRIGYHLEHSIDLPSLANLEQHGIARSRASTCFVFRELGDGTVDVYVKARVSVATSALTTAVDGLLAFSKAVECAQSKKLAHLMANYSKSISEPQRQTSRCDQCDRKFGRFTTGIHCDLCGVKVCSKCRGSVKVRKAQVDGTIAITPRVFCHPCITTADNTCTIEVARQEVAESARTSSSTTNEAHVEIPSPSREGTSSVAFITAKDCQNEATDLKSVDSFRSGRSRTTTATTTSCSLTASFEQESDASNLSVVLVDSCYEDEEDFEEEVTEFSDLDLDLDVDAQRLSLATLGLYEQMARLRHVAEKTYRLTVRNTDALLARHRSWNGMSTQTAHHY
ncbi:TPA: hypothetical protein N0F65_000257 [Lagenidium giganteum]|uniref:FYVE-type domain-containing protein n=1 Tax=Lagenidium giganteum TaxID=4803 RepID=A0AAV2Z7Z2_9STRA|nr:TPA: hypothetical protein N0F65_000257 [Lagenidium giganteum]